MKAVLLLTTTFLIGGMIVAASGAQGPASPPVSALAAAEGHVANAADNNHLADAVEAWNAEGSPERAGSPLVSRSADLLSGVGSAQDTITAFPTSRGAVCYHIRAAGTCGLLTGPAEVTVSILWTKNAGGRLFGVASDRVARVQVVIDDVPRNALLRGNAVYYELPSGIESSDVQRVVSTLTDGSTHVLPIHE